VNLDDLTDQPDHAGGLSRRSQVLALAALCLMVAALAWFWWQRETETLLRSETAETMAEIRAQMASELSGRTLTEALVRSWLGARPRAPMDAWDHPLHVLSTQGRVLIQSDGPDGRGGTPDDLTFSLITRARPP